MIKVKNEMEIFTSISFKVYDENISISYFDTEFVRLIKEKKIMKDSPVNKADLRPKSTDTRMSRTK
jgi:hypothetical protein